MTPKDVVSFFKNLGIKPTKSLSQNFLIDQNIISKLIHLAKIKAGERVLEIGAGLGAITQALLEKGAVVQAVEIDARLCKAALQKISHPNLSLTQENFLNLPSERFARDQKVIANLPFHITTPILEKLFQLNLSSITIIVQKELATRIKAPIGTKAFGPLSLFVKFYASFEDSFDISPSCFYPQPKVVSCALHLKLKTPPKKNPFPLIRKAYQKRRKMLSTSLEFPKNFLQEHLLSLGLQKDARPEMLSLENWIDLSDRLDQSTGKISSNEGILNPSS